MKRIGRQISTVTVALLFGAACAWAQSEQSQQGQPQQGSQSQQGQQKTGNQGPTGSPAPVQPSGQIQSDEQGPLSEGQSEAVMTEAPPLTGAEQYTLSRMGAGRSYVVPSFQFAQSVATRGTGAFGASEVDSVSTLSGLMAFHHVWSNYAFTARYAGTGFIYDQQSQLNTSAHELSISQRIDGRRSSLLLSDVVTYMPESSFGFARFSGFNSYGASGYGYSGLFGPTGGNLDTGLLPNQSILTGPSSRVGNSFVGEYDYRTSPLSSLTVTGAYSMLRFPSSGYIDNDSAIFQIGYNRTLTRKNSVALSYQAGILGFGGSTGGFTDHVVMFTFRHQISERLGLQFAAGPQINVFNNSTASANTTYSWRASGFLEYRLERAAVGISYLHYTNGGSGVYRGAETDQVGVYYSIPLGRMWSTDTDLGYARNQTVQNGNLLGVGSLYNSWYGAINVHRVLSRSLSMFIGYNLQQQLAGAPICTGSTCGTFYTQQYLSFGLNWHPTLRGVE